MGGLGRGHLKLTSGLERPRGVRTPSLANLCSSVVERLTLDQVVVGSIPISGNEAQGGELL